MVAKRARNRLMPIISHKISSLLSSVSMKYPQKMLFHTMNKYSSYVK